MKKFFTKNGHALFLLVLLIACLSVPVLFSVGTGGDSNDGNNDVLKIGFMALSAVPLVVLCIVLLMGFTERQDAERSEHETSHTTGEDGSSGDASAPVQPVSSKNGREAKVEAKSFYEIKLTEEQSEAISVKR